MNPLPASTKYTKKLTRRNSRQKDLGALLTLDSKLPPETIANIKGLVALSRKGLQNKKLYDTLLYT